jgi:acetyltransferase-like isoleucine patch superfamily enzyme
MSAAVSIGSSFCSNHNVLIREKRLIGSHVSIGTGAVIEEHCKIEDDYNLQSLINLPTNTSLGSYVFICPNTVCTNDTYPPNKSHDLMRPFIDDHASIGANVTILPGVHKGSDSLIAASSVTTKSMTNEELAIANI